MGSNVETFADPFAGLTTSESRTAWPFFQRSTRSEKSAAFFSLRPVATSQRLPSSSRKPSGASALAATTTWRASSSDMPRAASALGSKRMRTAGNDAPPSETSPTPCTREIFCSTMLSARS